MTLKSSSRKQFLAMFLQSMRQTLVMPILAFICLIFFSITEFNIREYMYSPFFWDSVRESGGLATIANICFVLAGVINAMLLFNFVWSKKQTNVIFSFGMHRRDIYFAKLLGGTVPMAFSLLLAGALEVFNCSLCGFTFGTRFLTMAALTVLQYIAVYVFSFVLCSAVMSNTGNVVEGLIFTFVLAFFGIMLEFFVNYSFWELTHGASITLVPTDENYATFNWASPFMAFNGYDESFMNSYLTNADLNITLNHWSGTICAFAYSVIIAALGYFGFRKRRNEISGTWGRAKGMNEIVSAVIGFYAAIICAFAIFKSSHGNGGIHTFIIFVIAFLLANIIFKLIFGYKRKKEILLALKHLPAYTVGFGAVFIAFATGLFGYSSYIPETNEITSVTISAPHWIFMEDYLSGESAYGLRSQNTRERLTYSPAFGELIMRNKYYSDIFPGIIFSDADGIAKASEIHKKLIADGKIKNSAPDSVSTQISVTYTLKDGSTVKRYYSETTEDTAEQLLLLNDTQQVKDALYDYANINLDLDKYRRLNGSAESDPYTDEDTDKFSVYKSDTTAEIMLFDFNNTSHTSQLHFFSKSYHLVQSFCYLFPKDMSGSQCIGLIDDEFYRAILTDMKNMSSAQYYHHSAEDEIGILSFGLSGSLTYTTDTADDKPDKYSEDTVYTTSWNLNSTDIKTVVVTKDMENTVRYLEEHDLMKYFEPRRSIDDIAHVKLATMSELYVKGKNSSNSPIFYGCYWTSEQFRLFEKELGKYSTYFFGEIENKITDKNKIEALLGDAVVYGFCSNESKIMEITYNDGSVATVMIPAGASSIK